ncbi:MAG: thioredoxin family protein [Rubrobacteraceae bacterium]
MAKLNTGDEAISFRLPGVDGETHSLTDYAGKAAVAVVFTCNHCPYARAWEDRIVSIQSDYGSGGLQVLAINANDADKYTDDGFPQMQQRAEDKGFNFPYLHDESQEIAAAYGAERTPEVFLFDGDRKLAYHGAVDDNYDDPEDVHNHYLREAVEAILSEEEPLTSHTSPVGCTIKWK